MRFEQLIIPALLSLALSASCGKKEGYATAACALDTAWTTADDFQLSTSNDSVARVTGSDLSGNLYVGGEGIDSSGRKYWVVRKSADRGSTWTGVDQYQLVATRSAIAYAFSFDPVGNIYFGGEAYDDSSIDHWVIRKSSNGGANWSVVDQDASSSFIRGMGRDRRGNPFAVGGDPHWSVRTSANNGDTWILADSVSSGNNDANAAATDAAGNIYVVGYDDEGGAANHWRVRKSSDDGATWTFVDKYQLSPDKSAEARGIVVHPTGDLFVSGYANDADSHKHWIVRKSADAGATWITVDDFVHTEDRNSESYSITADAFGTLYAAGSAIHTGSTPKWTVRASVDQGGSWTTTDSYILSAGAYSSIAHHAFKHPNGDVYVAGFAQNAATPSVRHWIVRRLACN